MGSGKFAGRWTDVGAVLGEIPAASAGMTEMGRGCDGGGVQVVSRYLGWNGADSRSGAGMTGKGAGMTKKREQG